MSRPPLFLRFIALFLIGYLTETNAATKSPKLETYNVDKNDVTVSGISSGGGMAIQMHFALSQTIKGSGLFEGGPFACAYENPQDVPLCLKFPAQVNVNTLIKRTDRLASKNKIDPTSNLKSSKIYIFHGTNDEVVPQRSSFNVETQCRHYGADVLTKFDSPCNHGQPVDGNGWGGPCEKLNENLVNECGYSGAFEMLNWLYGTPEKNLTRPEKGYVADGNIVKFDQNEFVSYSFLQPRWMADSGYLYIPKNCVNGAIQCKLHVAFHGCTTNEKNIGTGFATKTQYAEVAEVNNIIILFPQTADVPLLNPSGCWDWMGLTGFKTYSTKSGLEINAVYKMIKRITSVSDSD